MSIQHRVIAGAEPVFEPAHVTVGRESTAMERVDNSVDNSGGGPGDSPALGGVLCGIVISSILMLHSIHDLYDELERKRVMLTFQGPLSAELISALLGAMERRMEGIEQDPRIRRRVFNVVMECLQNLFHHNNNRIVQGGRTMSTDEPHGVVMIAQTTQGYQVLTGNFMAEGDVERLKGHLDRINSLPPEQLRELYRETLADGTYSAKGGGGLGMIDIARKSGGKLEYGFVPYDKDNAFFSLNVNVTN